MLSSVVGVLWELMILRILWVLVWGLNQTHWLDECSVWIVFSSNSAELEFGLASGLKLNGNGCSLNAVISGEESLQNFSVHADLELTVSHFSVFSCGPVELQLIASGFDIWDDLLDTTVCVWSKFKDSLCGQSVAVNSSVSDFELRLWDPSFDSIGSIVDAPILFTGALRKVSVDNEVGWSGLGHDRVEGTNTQENKHSFFHDWEGIKRKL